MPGLIAAATAATTLDWLQLLAHVGPVNYHGKYVSGAGSSDDSIRAGDVLDAAPPGNDNACSDPDTLKANATSPLAKFRNASHRACSVSGDTVGSGANRLCEGVVSHAHGSAPSEDTAKEKAAVALDDALLRQETGAIQVTQQALATRCQAFALTDPDGPEEDRSGALSGPDEFDEFLARGFDQLDY